MTNEEAYTKVYDPEIVCESKSVISGETRRTFRFDEDDEAGYAKLPLVQAFISDHEIQEMTIVSANVGFIKTFRKQLRGGEG